MIFPGTTLDLINHVVILATGLDKTSGTIYAFVRRSSDSFYLTATATWQAAKPTGASVPTATYVAHGLWKLNLSVAVTNALTPGDSVVCRMTDNETEASATVTSDVVEHSVDMLNVSAPSAAVVADAVWDEAIAGHQLAGSTGETLSFAANQSGGVALNHNYGGVDALQYVNQALQPIAGATIRVFTAIQWNALDLSRPLGTVQTDTNGRWNNTVFVAPGQYYVHFILPYEYGPNVVAVTVV